MAAEARRILVIDDEESFSRVLAEFLETRGYQVTVASDGLEGFRRATRERFDLITMDINMPALGGVEALRSMQMVEQPAKTVVISGYLTEEVTAECRQAGAAAVLAKPVELRHLGEVIAGLTGGGSPGGVDR